MVQTSTPNPFICRLVSASSHSPSQTLLITSFISARNCFRSRYPFCFARRASKKLAKRITAAKFGDDAETDNAIFREARDQRIDIPGHEQRLDVRHE